MDIIENGVNGYLDFDLKKAIISASKVDRNGCRLFALKNTWKKCSDLFFSNLEGV